MTKDEQLLINQIQEGDQNAFERLFNTYQPRLFRFLWHLVRSSEAAEDLVQNLFLTIWKNRTQFKPNYLSRYLYHAAKNSALNYLRQQKPHDMQYQNLNGFRDEQFRPDKRYDEKEMKFLIQRAIDSLPEGCRTVFILSRYENLKYQEIAEILEISVRTVENQIGRALRLLREQLKPLLQITDNYSA